MMQMTRYVCCLLTYTVVVLGIKWYHRVQNEKTEQPHLSATVQARHLSLFGLIARISDESDAKQILTASPWRTGGDHRVTPILRG